LDIVAALLLMACTAPLLLAAMGVVALAAGRPIFFGHLRVGKGGRVFRCWKLRTMTVHAEQLLDHHPELFRLHRENGFKLPASRDPRIIPGGRWLRRTHLDELPQLFNVLVGDMALVGPRPVVAEELELFGADVDVLLSTRPGVFGEWTSRGRKRPPYPERARLEVEWVRNRSPIRDLRILLRSVAVVLCGQEDG
jgi:lipopolysaccharide/colanic/teichoic acid biosynthesis glycosyltransferase